MPGPRGWLAGMCGMLFVALLPFSSYAVLLTAIQEEWSLGNARGAALFSAYLVGLSVASLVVVPLTDRLPAEPFVVAGAFVLTLSNLLFPLLAEGPESAAFLRFAAGCGHVTVYFPSIRIVAERFETRGRGSAVAAFVGAGYLGTTLSYAVTGAFFSASGSWRQAYGATAALGLFALPLAYFLCRGASSRERRSPGLLSLRPLAEKPLVFVIVAYALHSAELYLARLWLPLLLAAFLVRRGYEASEAAASAASISALLFTAGVAGVFFGGTFSDRVGRTLAAGSIFAVSGACSFVIGWLVGAPFLVLALVGVVYGFATAADSSVYSTALTELAPSRLLGSALAIQSFFGFLAGAVAPMIAGYLLDQLSGDRAWGIAFGFNGLLAMGGIVALAALRRQPRAAMMAAGRR